MPRFSSTVALVATCIPPILIAGVVARDAVNVPYMDQWVFGATVANAARGTLGFGELWQPNNEHRVVLPRLVMLALARVSGWDVRWEMAANFVLALGTLAVYAALIARAITPAPPWLVVVVSLHTFSMAQWQNWTWGWQMALLLNVFATAVAAYGLGRTDDPWRALAWMLPSTLAAVLSFASGFALAALVPVALLARHGRRAAVPAAVAAISAALIAAVYFAHFAPVGNEPPPVMPYRAPVEFTRYVAAYIGAPYAARDIVAARVAGIIGVAAFAASALRLWPSGRAAIVPWLIVGFYGLVAGALTAFGRLGAGEATAILPRYTAISAQFWTATSVLVAMALAEPPRHRLVRRAALVAMIGALVFLVPRYLRTWSLGDRASRARAAAMRDGAACLPEMETAPDACLRLLCWDANVLRFFAAPVKALGLGPFKPPT